MSATPPSKPTPNFIDSSKIPAELKERDQFVGWKYQLRNGKWQKPPYQSSGWPAKVNDPSTWSTFVDIWNAYESEEVDGINFVLTEADPYVGIDIDNVPDGEWSEEQRKFLPDDFPEPHEIVEKLASYTERSPSGKGIRIFAKGKVDGAGRHIGDFEIYDRSKTLSLTGDIVSDELTELNEAGEYLQELIDRLPAKVSTGSVEFDQREEHPDGVIDQKIINVMLVNDTFNSDTHVNEIWAGNWNPFYPSQSEADLALLSHICYFAGPYAAIIDRIFRQSGLYREKWEQDSYRDATLAKILDSKDEFHLWGEKKTDRAKPELAGNLQSPAPFPTDALPEMIADFVRQSSRAIHVDEAMVAVPMLSVLASLIGQARAAEIKPGWTEPSILWTAVICPVGRAKSPSMRAAKQPSSNIETMLSAKHEIALAKYNELLGTLDKGADKPPPPTREQFIVSDITYEALKHRLHENPKGLLYSRDELRGWFNDFNRYRGAGSDEEGWLEFESGSFPPTDRKGDDYHIAEGNCALSICGTIQPSVARSVLLKQSHTENGLSARLLICEPPTLSPSTRDRNAVVDDGLGRKIEKLGGQLYGLAGTVLPDGRYVPFKLKLDDDAFERFYDFKDEHEHEADSMVGMSALQGVWLKLNTRVVRIALVLSVVEQLLSGSTTVTAPITDEHIERAIQIVNWFGQEAERFYACIDEDEFDQELRELAQWVYTKPNRQVSVRNVKNGLRKYRRTPSEEIEFLLSQIGDRKEIKTKGRSKTVFQLP